MDHSGGGVVSTIKAGTPPYKTAWNQRLSAEQKTRKLAERDYVPTLLSTYCTPALVRNIYFAYLHALLNIALPAIESYWGTPELARRA
jgi:hypothetical protein